MKQFKVQDLDETNINHALTWFEKDQMYGIIDEKSGGIIGYIHRSHADRIVTKLNAQNKQIKG